MDRLLRNESPGEESLDQRLTAYRSILHVLSKKLIRADWRMIRQQSGVFVEVEVGLEQTQRALLTLREDVVEDRAVIDPLLQQVVAAQKALSVASTLTKASNIEERSQAYRYIRLCRDHLNGTRVFGGPTALHQQSVFDRRQQVSR